MEQLNHEELVELRARLVVIHTYLRLLNIELLVNPPEQTSIVEHVCRVQNHIREMDRLVEQISEPVTSKPVFCQN